MWGAGEWMQDDVAAQKQDQSSLCAWDQSYKFDHNTGQEITH